MRAKIIKDFLESMHRVAAPAHFSHKKRFVFVTLRLLDLYIYIYLDLNRTTSWLDSGRREKLLGVWRRGPDLILPRGHCPIEISRESASRRFLFFWTCLSSTWQCSALGTFPEEDASEFVLCSLEANHYRNGEFGETRGRGSRDKLKVHESLETSSQT